MHMGSKKRRKNLDKIAGPVAGILVLLAAVFLAASLCSAASGPVIPSVFQPEVAKLHGSLRDQTGNSNENETHGGQHKELVDLQRHGYQVDIAVGGRPFTTYYFDPAVAKPYLFPLRSARGSIVTRSFPMLTNIVGEERDEPHQRAMFFAHGSINGFDFWGEAAFPKWSNHSSGTFGRTGFRELAHMTGGSDSGKLRVTFDLVKPDGGKIAEETQAYTFSGDEQSRTVDCEFTISATEGIVEMGDTKEGTFAIRVAKALDSPPGHMVNSIGATGEKGIWGKQADWVDYYGNVGGEDVGIAVFDHPDNLRHPTYWHARGYGLIAANPFGLREFTHDRRADGSYSIPAGGSLTLRYRVLIHHGGYEEARLADAYREYVAEK